MVIYKDRSGSGVLDWEFDAVRWCLADADGTAHLLMLLWQRWPHAATDKRLNCLHILLDGDEFGQRNIYVDTRVRVQDFGPRTQQAPNAPTTTPIVAPAVNGLPGKAKRG